MDQHDQDVLAEKVADALFKKIQQEVGRTVLEKLVWALILGLLGGGIVYFKLKG